MVKINYKTSRWGFRVNEEPDSPEPLGHKDFSFYCREDEKPWESSVHRDGLGTLL